MANDACRKIINGNNWKKGTAVCDSDKFAQTQKMNGLVKTETGSYDVSIQNRLDVRFDDITYYTA